MIATSFWEAYSEGRNSWSKGKLGWKKKFLGIEITAYHFFLFVIMYPALLALPLIVSGWNAELFWILVIAYITGLVIEDFFWYVVNPAVKLKEFYTSFSDYYPWIRIGKKKQKIVPVFYVVAIVLAAIIWIWLVK